MIKNWWETLNEREHKLVTWGGSVFAVGLFYWVIWSPLGNAVVEQQTALAKQQKLNSWAQDAIVQIKAAGGKSNVGGGSLSQIVNQTSRQFNVKIDRMNPKDQQLNLLIDEISFNTLLNWLAHLEQKQGIKINNVDVSETDVPGMVRVPRLIIEKS
jgi:general secretion pathway protein M